MQLWRAADGASQSFLPASYFDEKEKTMRQNISDAEVYVLNEAPGKAKPLDGNVLGFIGVKDGSITGFFVDGPFQNQGLGKRLLDYVKERYEHLSLHVFEKNEGAVRFCKREGFTEAGRRKDPASGETELLMEWSR